MAKKKSRKKSKKNSKKRNSRYDYLLLVIFLIIVPISMILWVKYKRSHRESISNKTFENLYISDSPYLFGIDISHYQGKIHWNKLKETEHPIKYIFIRATMGKTGRDYRFKENWIEANKKGFIRGAYHYYRPNEDSDLQFKNFQSIVRLNKGDFIPILDVEKPSRYGKDYLRKGVLNWLKLAEKAYGVKPMVYTGLDFYDKNLKGYIDQYPIWIAAYSGENRLIDVNWNFHQFTEKVIVKGISSKVDGNNFNGDLDDLEKYLIN